MYINFDNKKVLVTGGTRGIGREIAKKFEENGAEVVITGTADTVPDWINNTTLIYERLDLLSDNWRTDFDSLCDRHSAFDVCINNAGINKVASIENMDPVDLDTILQANLNAPIYIASKVAKAMIERRSGAIINIASIFGVVTKAGRNPYTASKSGLIGVTKTIAVDLAPYGITVNAVSPGFVDTELTRHVLGQDGIEEMQKKIPMNRLASVQDIVPAILFLCSEHNTYITGQNLVIDGGFTLE